MSIRLFMFSCIASAAMHALEPAQQNPAAHEESMEDLLKQQVDPDILRALEQFRDKNCPARGTQLKLLHENACC